MVKEQSVSAPKIISNLNALLLFSLTVNKKDILHWARIRCIRVSSFVEIIKLRKGVIIWLLRKEGDLKDTHCNTQNAALNVALS